jgi:hypothetical protein
MNLTGIASGAVFLLACLPAQAQQAGKDPLGKDQVNVQIGTALVCDTQQQVERFVALFDGDVQRALRAVNDEQKQTKQTKPKLTKQTTDKTRHACDVATIAYVMGPEVSTARSTGGTFRIVRVVVLGVLTEQGLQASEPTPFYSAAQVAETEA